MRVKDFRVILMTAIVFLQSFFILAQPGEKRIQYPKSLKNSYFGVNMGYINYPFSSMQLEPGFTAQSVSIPHIAARLILYGHQFNKYLSAQISYMRPVGWVLYKNINGDQSNHSVWMNVGGLTLATQVPVSKNFSLFAEAGLGMVTRKGIYYGNTAVIKNAAYATGLFGAALQYHLNKKWDLQVSSTWSPAHAKEKQPHTIFYSTGFNYHLRELSKEKVQSNIKSGNYFAKQLLQFSFTTNGLGYGVNNFISKKLHIFWGGAVPLKQGFSVNYQRNIFHARKVFSLDWAAGMGYWKSDKKEDEFFTMSLYPVMRFTAFRSPKTDFFFEYTVAGPTFISKTFIGNEKTGKKFTFYDAMGIGIFTGKKKNLNAGLRIAHFSNGNIFPENNGVKVPLTFSLGYVLK